jgi:Ca2+-binding RTX toxin-like protein
MTQLASVYLYTATSPETGNDVIFAQRLGPDGTAIGDPLQVTSPYVSATPVSPLVLSNGGFVVVYNSIDTYDPNNSYQYLGYTEFTPDGVPLQPVTLSLNDYNINASFTGVALSGGSFAYVLVINQDNSGEFITKQVLGYVDPAGHATQSSLYATSHGDTPFPFLIQSPAQLHHLGNSTFTVDFNVTYSDQSPEFPISTPTGMQTYLYTYTDAGKLQTKVFTNFDGQPDLVTSSVTYTLPNDARGLKNLTLVGTDPISGFGNADNNVLFGNDAKNHLVGSFGDDRLDGKLGADYLEGGAGHDTFVFDTAIAPKFNSDLIADFTPFEDQIKLSSAIFSGLANGALVASAFVDLTTGHETTASRIVYDSAGNLFYDPDGSGSRAAIQFATLAGRPQLTAFDFLVWAGGNNPPDVDAGPDARTAVGEVFTLTSVNITDRDGDLPLTATVDWGDGSVTANVRFDGFGSTPWGNHIYQQPGEYIVTVTGSDGMAASSDSLDVTVDDASTVTVTRLSLTESEVGDGNSNQSFTLPNQTGGSAVRLQDERSSGNPIGEVTYGGDEGTTYVPPAGHTFRIVDIPSGVSQGVGFEAAILGTNGADSLAAIDGKVSYLNGGAGNDHLTGGDSSDTLIGGSGNDTIFGGAGDDVIQVNLSTGGADRVIGQGGMDHVMVSADAGLGHVALAFAAADVGDGSYLDEHSSPGSTALAVHMQAEAPDGTRQGAVSDYDDEGMIFTATPGLDFAVVDLVSGASRGNFDVVMLGARASQTLTATDPSSSYFIAGGKFSDAITGGSQNDMLAGGLGRDVLTGGGGNDSFLFNTTLSSGNVDTITDFSSGADKIVLDHSIFNSLAGGALPAAQYGSSLASPDGAHIIYEASTGALWYDPSAGAHADAVQFAVLANKPLAIAASDFLVI